MGSLPSAGFRTRTIVQNLRGMMFTCRGCKRNNITAAAATVPDLLNSYLKARGGPENPDRPLTAAELANDAYCRRCPLKGIAMKPLLDMAELMDRQVMYNAQALERKRIEQSRTVQSPTKGATPVRTSPLVALLATREPVVEKPTPQYRHRSKVPKTKRSPNAPKNYGESRQKAPENPNKAKKGQDSRKHKKKQGQ